MITHIGFDADDTLWGNEGYFELTAQSFLKILAEYNINSKALETFYEVEKKNLEYFGYGIKGFILSLIETSLYLTDNKISGDNIQKFISWGKQMQQAPVKLLPNVYSVLNNLKNSFKLIMITKGDLFDQELKIARSQLSDMFSKIRIVSEKNEEQYLEILKEEKLEVDQFIMVGNSLKSDIHPVVSIGARAVHIPYSHNWVNDELSKEKKKQLQYYKLKTIGELPEFIELLNNQIKDENKQF